MRIGVLGINHKSSELSLREILARACLHQFSHQMPIAQEFRCVVLSTCNRSEIYFSAEDLAVAHAEILSCLRKEVAEPFEHKLYTYFGFDCFFHLAMVTSGLDSVILGESEIQRQVKLAYEATLLYYSLPSCMHFLFQKSLKIGKQIRSTGLSLGEDKTLSGMILQMSRWFFENIENKKILFIGNSEINRRTMASFKRKGMHSMALCTRGVLSAEEIGKELGLSIYDWSHLDAWIDYDLVICGTNHAHYVLTPKQIEGRILKTRLLVDLSVPRTVDPLLGKHSQLTLFNIEELGRFTDQKRHSDDDVFNHLKEMVWSFVHRQIEIFHCKTSFIPASKEEKKAPLCIG